MASTRQGRWQRYVAVGDSLTEGMCDPGLPGQDHPWRGWADRLAEALAARAVINGEPFDYANLAVRGRLLPQIVGEQLDAALAMAPDLVSIIGGGNDVLRPGVDLDDITAALERAVARARATGADVLMATAYDPRLSPLVRRTRGLAGIFTAQAHSIARRQGAYILDLWGMPSLQDRRMWAPDRIHLTAPGHHRVAQQALDVLGIGAQEDWATALPSLPPRGRQEAWREDSVWLREHVVPWVGRRLRGRSSGDGLAPKRPQPSPVGTGGSTPG